VTSPTLPPAKLSDDDLRERLNDVFRTQHRSCLVALAGVGVEREIDTEIGRFLVMPVDSEIDLRKKLANVDKRGEAKPLVAFLVPWTGELPLDIGGRFTNSGRILPLGKDVKLRRLFGANGVDDAVLTSPLARHLVERPGRERFRFKGGRLTLDALWTSWLSEECRLFERDDVSLVAMLAWAAQDRTGPAFGAALDAANGADVRTALLKYLDGRIGRAGSVVWRAWEAGRGERALEFAIVFDALATSDDAAVRMWRTLKAKDEFGVPSGPEQLGIVKSLGESAVPALRLLTARNDGERLAAAIVANADRLADVDEVRRATKASRWLPSAWDAQLERLGALLAAGAASPSRETIAAAAAVLRELEWHARFHKESERLAFKRAEMAVRLLTWLLDSMDERWPAQSAGYGEAVRLARWYAHDGGFVDWARRVARGPAANALGTGIAAVVAAADAKRTRLDRAFAFSLPRWLESKRPSTQVLPISTAVERLVGKALDAAKSAPIAQRSAATPDRRFLVLLVDGMAWAQAAELLLSLTEWGPTAWNASGVLGAESGPAYAPVLAHLPTITEVSRAAFFAGKEPTSGREEPTSKDEERWRAHPIGKHFATGDTPRLLLRAEGHSSDGSATLEAINAVKDTRLPVVAMVINAIDASLKADSQLFTTWNLGSIRSLRDLLDAARDAGRLVLLASDHGHVPADRLVSCGTPPDARARWRPWRGAGDAIADYEVMIPKSLAWAPPHAEGVVLLADDEHRYGGAPHAGEHGGATLAEVVAPAILLGYEGAALPVGARDAEMRVGPPYVPRWWYFEVDAARPTEPATAPRPAVAPSPQLTLIDPTTATPLVEPALPKKKPTKADDAAPAALHALAIALAETELFRKRPFDAQKKARLQLVVSYLAGRDDRSAPIEGFAGYLGVMSTRAPGLIAALGEWLNVDGYTLLWHDPASNRVHLDVEKLKLLYEIP
jgi:hypothetical protein